MTQDIIGLSLPALRRALCEAEIVMRHLQAAWPNIKAMAEKRVIDGFSDDGQLLGSNEAERQRKLVLGLARDPAYSEVSDDITHQQDLLDRLRTELKCRLEKRIEDQLAARNRLAGALEAANARWYHDDDDNDDGIVDEAADLKTAEMLLALPVEPELSPEARAAAIRAQADEEGLALRIRQTADALGAEIEALRAGESW